MDLRRGKGFQMRSPFTFEERMQIGLVFSLTCVLVMSSFVLMRFEEEINGARYNVTQNGTTYTGKILQGHSTVSVTDKDNNTVILDAAYGPISIRTSNLDN
jgi:hypothetical protein